MFQDVREVNGIPLRLIGTQGESTVYYTRASEIVQPRYAGEFHQSLDVYFWTIEGHGCTWSTQVNGIVHPYLESSGVKFWHQLCDAVQNARAAHDEFARAVVAGEICQHGHEITESLQTCAICIANHKFCCGEGVQR